MKSKSVEYSVGDEKKKMGHRIHRFDRSMRKDQNKLEQFLNSLGGEGVATIPNVTGTLASTVVDFILIVEKLS